MDCGPGVSLCGVLVLQSGLGHNHYKHREPHVHGLWPETGKYGGSECVRPSESLEAPHIIRSCYQDRDESPAQLLNFQRHEWQKHGTCAGVTSASDYFAQVCELSEEPLQVLAAARRSGGKINKVQNALTFWSMVKALTTAGYPIWQVRPETGELLLSACSGEGKWKLSKASMFSQTCGKARARAGGAAAPKHKKLRKGERLPVVSAEEKESDDDDVEERIAERVDALSYRELQRECMSRGLRAVGKVGMRGDLKKALIAEHMAANAPKQMCVSGQHGPECSQDADCGSMPGCLRCAHSGFCTQEPLPASRNTISTD